MRQPGFLGTEASLGADIALVGSVLVMIAFTVGAYLALRGRYEAHRWVQTGAAVANVLLVLGVMIPSLLAVAPSDNVELPAAAFVAMPAHELLGLSGLLFGLFVVLRGNGLVPARLKFTRYKLFMRAAYGLYLAATLVGVAVYMVLYT
ncbi:hypothetical protein K2Z83_16790 [Oscillochloris sp. ZM17-4]|uniref:hypothetical protein n=1 Tax=Oscillochloris sp. ZM17-4 TaxID=2866714 RepID=UPI001C73DF97|nr:hypothetical protein [Oscillochloris sp. ZM17-4]MBX0329330.1 hypothetical protein [Oscillochloris sp. ZM17-4]